jgi:hypothetical protein
MLLSSHCLSRSLAMSDNRLPGLKKEPEKYFCGFQPLWRTDLQWLMEKSSCDLRATIEHSMKCGLPTDGCGEMCKEPNVTVVADREGLQSGALTANAPPLFSSGISAVSV